jgi:hypothetical protein
MRRSGRTRRRSGARRRRAVRRAAAPRAARPRPSPPPIRSGRRPQRDSSVRWFFRFYCILSRIEGKTLKFFFNVVLIFTELGQDLIHLAHIRRIRRENFFC